MVGYQVFDISTLQIFTPHELDYLLCGRRELWQVSYLVIFEFSKLLVLFASFIESPLQAETLAEHIKFDHGYTAKSPAIINVSSQWLLDCFFSICWGWVHVPFIYVACWVDGLPFWSHPRMLHKLLW